MHHTSLITTIVAGLVLAFVFGWIAQRLRLSPLVGYLVAGVLIGPATPGYVADLELAPQLAEIGVILLMFGVGLHFSLRDLMSVRLIAVPGALAQIGFATLLGAGLGWSLGWTPAASLVFGLALSVASTVVLLRALQERHLIETARGRIAVGWLIVEDLAMVLALVLLPAVAGALADADGTAVGWTDLGWTLAITLAKVAAFVALMLVAGRRVIPWALHRVAGSGSAELFTLSVLALALGIAFGSAELFGVSFALGAFFAGMVLAESELSHRAAEDSLPLRDAFAVLFFVSVGMLLDPAVFVEWPLALLATVLIIVVGKSAAAYAIVRAARRPHAEALTISSSLAQIGEFSFILATLGLDLGLLSPEAQDLIVAGAIVSIVLNPLLFAALDRLAERAAPAEPARAEPRTAEPALVGDARGSSIVVGYGMVGRTLAAALEADGRPFVVVDDREEEMAGLRARGIEAISGNAADALVLDAAGIAEATWLFVAIPNVFEAGQVVERGRRANPGLRITARAENDTEVAHLRALGADAVVIGRRELALGMQAAALGRSAPSATAGPGAPAAEMVRPAS